MAFSVVAPHVHDDNLIVNSVPCPAETDCRSYASFRLKFLNHLVRQWAISFTLGEVLPSYENLKSQYEVKGPNGRKGRINGIYSMTTTFHVVIPQGPGFTWTAVPFFPLEQVSNLLSDMRDQPAFNPQ